MPRLKSPDSQPVFAAKLHADPRTRSRPAVETSTVISSVDYAGGIGGDVKVPFTWKVTGWFMVGWSAEFPANEVRPLRYFGEDLVAYRDDSGELHVLSGPLQTPRRAHRTRRQSRRRLCRVPVPRMAVGTRRHQPLHPVSTGQAQPRAQASGVPGQRAARLRVRLAPTPGQRAAVGDAGHLHIVPAVRDRPRRRITARTRSFHAGPRTSRYTRRSWPRTGRTAPTSTTCTAPR